MSDNVHLPTDREIGLHWQLSKVVIGAYYAVRRELGPGLAEYVYINALAVALRELGVACRREVPYEVVFRGVVVGMCRADLVVEDRVLVEAKVAERITPAHREQTWFYLKASGLKVGLILTFGDKPATGRIEVA